MKNMSMVLPERMWKLLNSIRESIFGIRYTIQDDTLPTNSRFPNTEFRYLPKKYEKPPLNLHPPRLS